jgi:hypothetical protein
MKVEKVKKSEAIVKPIKAKAVELEIPPEYHEISGFPSKGKLYHKDAKIFARPLKILEIKQLTNMTDTNYSFIINNVLKQTVILDKIDFDDLVVADKFYLIFWQRANTYQGDGFSIDFNCESCMHIKIKEDQNMGVETSDEDLREASASKYTFDISALNLEDVKDDYDPNTLIDLDCGDKVTIFQHTVASEMAVDSVITKKSIPNVDEDLLNIASVISSINGSPVDIKTAYAYLINIQPSDFIKIINYKDNFDINIKPSFTVNCKKCGGEVETPLTFRPDFFLPKYSV